MREKINCRDGDGRSGHRFLYMLPDAAAHFLHGCAGKADEPNIRWLNTPSYEVTYAGTGHCSFASSWASVHNYACTLRLLDCAYLGLVPLDLGRCF